MLVETGVFISGRTLAALPEDLRGRILAAVCSARPPEGDGAAEAAGPSGRSLFGRVRPSVVDLSVVDAQRLLGGVRDSTRLVLVGIARRAAPRAGEEGEFFEIAEVARDVGVRAVDLGGVWSGITRRLRAVTHQGGCHLIDWCGAPLYEGSVYVGQTGRVTGATLAALRAAVGLGADAPAGAP